MNNQSHIVVERTVIPTSVQQPSHDISDAVTKLGNIINKRIHDITSLVRQSYGMR